VKKFVLRLGIDRAIFFTLLSRVWNIGAGLLTLILIAHFLSPELQGYYYTFNSLIALQIFAELGLNFAIVQFASHEMAHLKWQADGTVAGELQSKRHLQSLMHFTFAWLAVAAILLIALLLPAGMYFFNKGGTDVIRNFSVNAPWMLLVVFTSVNLLIGASAAILEGCGKVVNVAKMRLSQAIFAVTAAWITLYLGGSLYALAVSSLMMALIGAGWLWLNYRIFFKDLLTYKTSLPGMNWRKEIWPFQWRIAVSWASGYFIFHIFNPLLFKTHGPIAAGQMGMTMQIFGAMNGAAMVWITTKIPAYGQLIATNQRAKLDSLFLKGFIQSSLFLLFGTTTLWLILFYLRSVNSYYAERILDLKYFSVLCFISLVNHIVFAESSYLRAHKKEPFMGISIYSGISTLTLAFALIPSNGLYGAIISYSVPAVIFGLIGGSYIFVKQRKKWGISLKE